MDTTTQRSTHGRSGLQSTALSNGHFVLFALMLLASMGLLAQIAIDFSTVNIASACIVYASSMLMLLYLLWTPSLHTHPLSTFSLFGFCFTTQLGALLGQAAMLTSLADNLRQPIETFATLAGYQATALLAHTVHRWLLHPPGQQTPSPPRQLLAQLGLYATPGTGALWLMGYVGMLAFVIGSGRESAFAKLLQAASFLTWAPYLIPMYLMQMGELYCNARRQYTHLALFSGLVVLLGMAANARSIILSGFMTVALFALLLAMRNTRPVSMKRVFQLGVLGLVLAAIAIPVSDLATAMVVARKVRGNVSAVQMVQETFHYLGDPDALAGERRRVRDEALGKYDEFYLANPLLARLVETKFHDNAFYFVSRFSSSDTDRLAETTMDMLWSILPDPVIKAVGVNVDKRDLRFSMGDYLSHLSQGGPLGSYRTGSALAQGTALLGVGFVAVYFVACLLVFLMIDLLSYRSRSGTVLLSAVGMLLVWKLFLYSITADSLHAWLSLAVRTLPQALLFYLLLASVARGTGWLFAAPTRGLRGREAFPQR